MAARPRRPRRAVQGADDVEPFLPVSRRRRDRAGAGGAGRGMRARAGAGDEPDPAEAERQRHQPGRAARAGVEDAGAARLLRGLRRADRRGPRRLRRSGAPLRRDRDRRRRQRQRAEPARPRSGEPRARHPARRAVGAGRGHRAWRGDRVGRRHGGAAHAGRAAPVPRLPDQQVPRRPDAVRRRPRLPRAAHRRALPGGVPLRRGRARRRRRQPGRRSPSRRPRRRARPSRSCSCRGPRTPPTSVCSTGPTGSARRRRTDAATTSWCCPAPRTRSATSPGSSGRAWPRGCAPSTPPAPRSSACAAAIRCSARASPIRGGRIDRRRRRRARPAAGADRARGGEAHARGAGHDRRRHVCAAYEITWACDGARRGRAVRGARRRIARRRPRRARDRDVSARRLRGRRGLRRGLRRSGRAGRVEGGRARRAGAVVQRLRRAARGLAAG